MVMGGLGWLWYEEKRLEEGQNFGGEHPTAGFDSASVADCLTMSGNEPVESSFVIRPPERRVRA